MAFTKYTKDTTIIGALGTNPAERGLTTQEFKDKFDQFAHEFVAWFNETHLPEVAEKAVLDEHKAETAPHAETVNRMITVGVGKDFETIQGAIDSLKKRVDNTIGIAVDAGIYNEDVKIEGFIGKGSIQILGANQLVDAGNYKIKSLTASQCSAHVYIRGFESTTTTADSFLINNSIGVVMYYCLATASSTFAGVKVGFSTVQISNSQVSNHAQALYVYRASTVASNVWTAGSGNAVGIECHEGSTVGKYLGQPQGTTAEVTTSGGVIR